MFRAGSQSFFKVKTIKKKIVLFLSKKVVKKNETYWIIFPTPTPSTPTGTGLIIGFPANETFREKMRNFCSHFAIFFEKFRISSRK